MELTLPLVRVVLLVVVVIQSCGGFSVHLRSGTLSPVVVLPMFVLYVGQMVGPSMGAALEIKIGALFTSNRCCDLISFEDKASAMNIAIDQLHADGIVDKDTVTFKFLWGDSYTQSVAIGEVIAYIRDDDVDVIFGSPLSTLTSVVGHVTTHYLLPHITWSSNSLELGNKTLYRTLVRTVGPLNEVGPLIVTLFREFGWRLAGLLYADKDLCRYVISGVKLSFAENNMTFTQTISYHEDTLLTDDVIDGYLRRVKQTSRVIYLCEYEGIRDFVVRACKLGMCDGNYLFVYTWVAPPMPDEWKKGDEFDEIAKLGYRYVLHITIADWKGDEGKKRIDDFHIEVIERMSDPPWNTDLAQRQNLTVQHFQPFYGTSYLYEAMYLYGMWINYTLEHPLIQRKDGQAWLRFASNRSFQGIGGPCDIGVNGDKVPYFWVYQFIGESMASVKVAESEDRNTKLLHLHDFTWYTQDGLPPKDVPECGFFNDLCPAVDKEENTAAVIVSCFTVFLCLTGGLMIGYILRKRKLEKELLQRSWKVNIADIYFQKSKTGASSRMNFKSQSALSGTSSITGQENLSRYNQERTSSVTVAVYKNQTVAMKNGTRMGLLSNQEVLDLQTMREFLHDNINPFIGACFDAATPCTLFVYCPKGSLQDILENEEIELDTNFKNSLTMDLVQGMLYIHNSKLGSHGRLKSTNCLVDNRWVLKVTDYGIGRFLQTNDLHKQEEHQRYKGLLWTSPEHLGNNCTDPKGSKEGDVYSFSIILHEIFYRMGTFAGHGHMTPKDIIGRVKNREVNPCRPDIFSENNDVIPAISKLMQLCWHDNEAERPTFSVIRSYVRKHIQNGMTVNIVDVILQRLEKYSTNLEELVDQRTQQLLLEKQKSDKLLYRMLPKSCADKLKMGEFVRPELFESATVFFSDICDFTAIASMCSPMEVVDLLNDLYICFDDIIGKYDAFKVETIGDAYLVVSGVPNRNGNLHAGIIADMSLDILQKVKKFKIKHLPHVEVMVRIGNHTGSCCAGIVGLSMPKYCLFGDTVNTASRMESNGASQSIHISETTNTALQKIGGYNTEFRAELEIKGKGLMKTYWLIGNSNTRPASSVSSTTAEKS